ncbi:glycosyltransferase [Novosphingobium sp. AAP93]|uniref:glycosyltransferase n=1 Tax=Novosphingobium sp. AAP93 TaxID=1523427 RepID=UPI0006B8ABCA|nr:glycosyltransferase [Novosphingobium sp. AAP93]KPF88246.1 glycosyl transferase family 2 [Novosphingobium sp. AAP93]
MIPIALGTLSLAIWLVMLLGRDMFWLARERDTRGMPPQPQAWPEVVAVVPARDEADVIARSVGSLLTQDYPGRFRVILVDDQSSDGTADIARALGSDRLEVLSGAPLSRGWTGKLWAVSQGVARAGEAPRYLWLTDADIEHAPDTLRMLVTRGEAGKLSLVSLMALLHCETPPERMLVPAFVFFFQMLYPFGAVNRPQGLGAAAGGCMLVRRDSLEKAGGIAAIRGALIDDCTLGALLKRQGPVWLGLTYRSRSIRPYRGFAPVAAMISRSAYAQLRYSPVLLAGTVFGMALVYLAPPALGLFGEGPSRWLGLGAWAIMALTFQPMLRFYRRSPLWGVALPGIAAFYLGCTMLSAWQHLRGRGGMWKGRAQAAAGQQAAES